MERLSKRGGDSAAFSKVQSGFQHLDANLKALATVIAERSGLSARLRTQVDAAHKMHTRISEQLAPIVDDSYFDVMMSADEVGRNDSRNVKSEGSLKRSDLPPTSLASRQIAQLRNALETSPQINLIS